MTSAHAINQASTPDHIDHIPVAFIDRDGTIVMDYPDTEWAGVSEPEFLPDAIFALRQIQDLGFGIVIVTNQYLIGESLITPLQYLDFSSAVLKSLRRAGISPLDVLHCPHKRTDACPCHKPGTGMAHDAMQRHPELSFTGGIVVGDSTSDMQFAEALGLKSYQIASTSADNLQLRSTAMPRHSWLSILEDLKETAAPD